MTADPQCTYCVEDGGHERERADGGWKRGRKRGRERGQCNRSTIHNAKTKREGKGHREHH
jgi:hypothetical protein